MFTRRSKIRRFERSRVVVTDSAGSDFAGVLERVLADAVVLRATEQAWPGTDRPPMKLDGEIVLLRDQIRFLQVLG